jgi:hypothetical protein
MRSKISAGLLGAVIAAIAIFSLSQLSPREARADSAIVVEQYKLIGLSSKEQLEQELNRLGADGWRVRASIASMVILAK